MPTVTLSARAYGFKARKTIEEILRSKLEGLEVKARVVGVAGRGWVKISLEGDDSDAAINLLKKEIGVCPEEIQNVLLGSVLVGHLVKPERCKGGMLVDIGVFSPEVVDAEIPLSHLQAVLADGRKVKMDALMKLFNFRDNLPLTVEISRIGQNGERFEARIADVQSSCYGFWIRSLMDRLIILGVSLSQMRHIVKVLSLGRDIVRLEQLRLLVCVAECKLGTDAAGLIPKLGKALPTAEFSLFSPRRIKEFMNS